MTDFFIFLSSLDSVDKFKTNNPFDFTVELPKPITIHNQERYYWSVSMSDISIHLDHAESSYNSPFVHVMCDIVSVSIIRNAYKPLLRSFSTRVEGRTNRTFLTATNSLYIPQYFPIINNHFNRIRIYLTDHNLKNINYIIPNTGELTCSLHFQMTARTV